MGEIERLDPEPVAGQRQAARLAIPERDREHAVEPAQRRQETPIGAGLEHDFGVALATEGDAVGFEFRTQVGEIVDLAVEDDDDRAILVCYRLPAPRQVDD